MPLKLSPARRSDIPWPASPRGTAAARRAPHCAAHAPAWSAHNTRQGRRRWPAPPRDTTGGDRPSSWARACRADFKARLAQSLKSQSETFDSNPHSSLRRDEARNRPQVLHAPAARERHRWHEFGCEMRRFSRMPYPRSGNLSAPHALLRGLLPPLRQQRFGPREILFDEIDVVSRLRFIVNFQRPAVGGNAFFQPRRAALAPSKRYKDGPQIVLRRGPIKRHALARALLERLAKGHHRLLQLRRAVLPQAESLECGAEGVLCGGPIQRHALASEFFKGGAKGSDGFLQVHRATLSLAQPEECTSQIVLRHSPVERHALTGVFLQRLAVNRHGLLQPCRAVLPLTDRFKRGP